MRFTEEYFRKINLNRGFEICPGLCRTDVGGPSAHARIVGDATGQSAARDERKAGVTGGGRIAIHSICGQDSLRQFQIGAQAGAFRSDAI
jgi:hypothetical protein